MLDQHTYKQTIAILPYPILYYIRDYYFKSLCAYALEIEGLCTFLVECQLSLLLQASMCLRTQS